MEKMVPMETFTSMLAEPSRGSYSTTYLPEGFPGGTGTGAGSSSDAVTHTRPVYCTLWRTVSLANRSSFCCRSPETFTAPAGPRMSLKPARRTCREMIFAARHKSYSRFDSSPVASGCSRSCSMMKRSIVMTSEPCTVAVRGESDRAALVGPEHRDTVRRQARQRLPRLGPQLGIERLDHGGHAAQVIGVAMGRHRHRDPAGALAPQERDHDTSAGVGLRRAGARVDHDPTSVGGAQRRRIPLP